MDEFRNLIKTFDRMDKKSNKLSRNNYISYERRSLNLHEDKIKNELSNELNFRRFRLCKKSMHYKGKYDL